jgi:hypothetical protein
LYLDDTLTEAELSEANQAMRDTRDTRTVVSARDYAIMAAGRRMASDRWPAEFNRRHGIKPLHYSYRIGG